jgi:hypothetical protein
MSIGFKKAPRSMDFADHALANCREKKPQHQRVFKPLLSQQAAGNKIRADSNLSNCKRSNIRMN